MEDCPRGRGVHSDRVAMKSTWNAGPQLRRGHRALAFVDAASFSTTPASSPSAGQQPVHALQERRRIRQWRTGGKLGLLQQQMGEIGRAGLVGLALQAAPE